MSSSSGRGDSRPSSGGSSGSGRGRGRGGASGSSKKESILELAKVRGRVAVVVGEQVLESREGLLLGRVFLPLIFDSYVSIFSNDLR